MSMKTLQTRMPPPAQVFLGYSVIAFWAYLWAGFVFAFNAPSWVLYASLGEVVGYLSYAMVFIFLDTLAILCILLFVTIALPPAWLALDFPVSGTIIGSLLFFWIVYGQIAFNEIIKSTTLELIETILLAIISSIAFVLIGKRLSLLRRLLQWFSSSASLFGYMYGLLSSVGFFIVLIRNIF